MWMHPSASMELLGYRLETVLGLAFTARARIQPRNSLVGGAMANSELEASAATAEPALTLQDLLDAESEVLKRVGREYGTERAMAGHNSSTSGHNMSGIHSSHTSAKVERPLQD